MPSVRVVDVLTSKVHGSNYKDANHEGGDRSRGEDGENKEVLKDEEIAEIYPMDMLFECAPDLETPKNKVTGNESSNAHPGLNAHWCGQSTCPSDRIALEVLQELAKLCTCSSDPNPKHCGLKLIALIG